VLNLLADNFWQIVLMPLEIVYRDVAERSNMR
jgi:hypothetical protein